MFNIQIDGNGPAILLLHSFWGSSRLFESLRDCLLAAGYCVVQADLPGHGDSASPSGSYTFESLASELVLRLINSGFGNLHSIIGHSMGGYLALAMVNSYPDFSQSLVLLHSPLRPATAESIDLRQKEARFLRSGKKELWLRMTLASNFAPGNERNFQLEFDLLTAESRKVTAEGALAAIEAINNRCDYRPFFETWQTPVLFFIGLHDLVYSAAEMVEDSNRLCNGEVVMLNHSGHLGFWEDEEQFCLNLKKFLSERES